MKKLSVLTVLLLAACANNPQGGAVVGGAVGGAVGSTVGYDVGGRTGSILGGAIGAATGAILGSDASRGGRNAEYDQRRPAENDRRDERRGEYRRADHGGDRRDGGERDYRRSDEDEGRD